MIRTACVLFFLIGLSSCSSSKNERVYYIAVADANKAAAPKKAKAAPKESRPKPHKITIRDAVLESLENNRVVLIFIEQEGIARANTALAKSDLLPSFAANLNYERLSEQFENTIGPVKVPLGPQDQWNFAISADFPIYSFGRYLNAYRAAKLAQAGLVTHTISMDKLPALVLDQHPLRVVLHGKLAHKSLLFPAQQLVLFFHCANLLFTKQGVAKLVPDCTVYFPPIAATATSCPRAMHSTG